MWTVNLHNEYDLKFRCDVGVDPYMKKNIRCDIESELLSPVPEFLNWVKAEAGKIPTRRNMCVKAASKRSSIFQLNSGAVVSVTTLIWWESLLHRSGKIDFCEQKWHLKKHSILFSDVLCRSRHSVRS